MDFTILRAKNQDKLNRLNLPQWKPKGKILVQDPQTPTVMDSFYNFVLKDDKIKGSHGRFCAQVIRIVGGDDLQLYLCGSGSTFEETINYAIENNIRVISASWGGGSPWHYEPHLKRYADWGGIYVAAAGNYEYGRVNYPASSDYAIAVSSTYGDDCNGPEIDITADRNYWIYNDGLYQPFDGTSCSCPAIAACVLYILDAHPEYKLPDVIKYLQAYSKPLEEPYERFFSFPTIEKPVDRIVFHIDSEKYIVNGQEKVMDTVPKLDDNNRTLVPIRFVAEALGCKVDWNPETQKITITR